MMVNTRNKKDIAKRKYPVRTTRNKRPTNNVDEFDFPYEEPLLQTCDLCHRQCKNEQDLLKHRAKHAAVPVSRLSICKECPFYTTSPTLLHHHATTHQPVIIKSEKDDDQDLKEPTCTTVRLAPDPVKREVKSEIPKLSLSVFEKPVPIRSRIIFEDDDYNVALLSQSFPAYTHGEACQPQLGRPSCPMEVVPAPSIKLAACTCYDDLIQPKQCLCQLCGTQFDNMFLLLQHNVVHIQLNIFGMSKPDMEPPTDLPVPIPTAPVQNQTVEENLKRRIAKPNFETLNILRNSLKEGSDYKTCSSCFKYVHNTGLNFKLLHFVGKNRVTQTCDICKDKSTLIIYLKVLKPEHKRNKRKTNLDRLTNICRRLNTIRRRVRIF